MQELFINRRVFLKETVEPIIDQLIIINNLLIRLSNKLLQTSLNFNQLINTINTNNDLIQRLLNYPGYRGVQIKNIILNFGNNLLLETLANFS